MAKGAYAGIPTKRDALKYLEYIQSSGTQYIDTGFKPNQNTRAVLDAQMVGANSQSVMYCPMGVRGGGYFFELFKSSTASWNLDFLWGNMYPNYFTIDYTKRYVFEINKNTATVGEQSFTYTNQSFQLNYNLYLGADNNAGNVLAPAPLRIYSCQIYDNGSLIRDFAPCEYTDGRIGLYDKVNSLFYPNAGTDTFTAGSVVEEVGGDTAEVARKWADIFVSPAGIARKGMKAYIGDASNIARLWWSSGMPISNLPVGTLVQMNVNGTARNFIMVHQGKPSDLYDDSCDGAWLMMKDIYELRAWDGTSASDGSSFYPDSDINIYLNGGFLGLFDAKVQNAIKQVKIPYINGTAYQSPVASGASGLSVKVFLPSIYEVRQVTSSDQTHKMIDGATLDYFAVNTDAQRIAYLNGTATGYWMRDHIGPAAGNPSMNTVNYKGGTGTRTAPWATSLGIRPTFIVPFDAKVNPEPNADGSYTLLV